MNPTDPQPDRELELLVTRCQLGERAAFEALIARWATPLHRHLLRVTGDPVAADDLAQDVWFAVLRGLGGLRDPAKFRAWLFGIAHRRLMDRFRDRAAADFDAGVDVSELPAGPAERESLHVELEAGLARLPVTEREVLTLFHLEGLTLAETAAALGVPAGTVKSRLHRARALLRARFNDQEDPA